MLALYKKLDPKEKKWSQIPYFEFYSDDSNGISDCDKQRKQKIRTKGENIS